MTGEAPLTEDRLLGGRVRLCQPARGYRAAIDPVLLAAAVPARPGERVLDLGTGTGAAALCLAARVEGCEITGLEAQPELARIAAGNVALNRFGGRVRIVTGDLACPPPALGGAFDRVMANPPYWPPGRAAPSARADPSRVETTAPLAQWVAAAAGRLRPKGGLTFIHRADRLDELLALLRAVAGEITLAPLWPRAGAAAKRVLVGARLGARTPPKLGFGLVLHDADGAYTPEAEAILRDAKPLEI